METKECLKVGTSCVSVAGSGKVGCMRCPVFSVSVEESSGILTMYCVRLVEMLCSGMVGSARCVEAPVSAMAVWRDVLSMVLEVLAEKEGMITRGDLEKRVLMWVNLFVSAPNPQVLVNPCCWA